MQILCSYLNKNQLARRAWKQKISLISVICVRNEKIFIFVWLFRFFFLSLQPRSVYYD